MVEIEKVKHDVVDKIQQLLANSVKELENKKQRG